MKDIFTLYQKVSYFPIPGKSNLFQRRALKFAVYNLAKQHMAMYYLIHA